MIFFQQFYDHMDTLDEPEWIKLQHDGFKKVRNKSETAVASWGKNKVKILIQLI